MTRREEIEKVANEFYKGDEVSTFVVAAEWADKTMIEKAAKWLQDQVFGQEILLYEEDIASFRKAMEE